jgi:hypothetical protein
MRRIQLIYDGAPYSIGEEDYDSRSTGHLARLRTSVWSQRWLNDPEVDLCNA